jgi:hypothetical protein
MNTSLEHKQRGVFLMIMLVVYAIWYVGYLVNDILINFGYYGVPLGGQEVLGLLVRITFFLSGIVGLMGIIFWRKWGAYLLGITVIIMALTSIIYSGDGETFTLTILPLIFILWAIARKWKAFV